MIARIWRGATRAADADAYLAYLDRTGHAEYRRVAGHSRTVTLRRTVGDRAEFVVLTLWDSLDTVRGFAGTDVERAVFYPEDDRYLVAREDRVAHFDVVYEDSDEP
jgi:heme-degrading monooxygenase HmoA